MVMRRKIKIAGKLCIIQPLPARQSLEAVVKLSSFMHDTAPLLSVLADPDRRVRVTALLRIIKEREEIPTLIFELVSMGTGIAVAELEQNATLKEVLTVLFEMIRVNDWDLIWYSAMQLRIIDKNNLTDWLFAHIPRGGR